MLDNETLFSLLAKGGAMQIFIALASVIAIAIIIERYLFLIKTKREAKTFLREYSELLKNNEIDAALEFSRESGTMLARIAEKGLTSIKLGKDRVAASIESEGKKAIYELERGFTTLSTISGVAPLLGFLGTVTGMISAFMEIQNSEGVVNPSALAGGIWEALITTASGLAVGIIALSAYNYFLSRVKRIILDIETVANITLDKISETE